MKRMTVLFVILALVLILVACGGSDTPVEIPVEAVTEPTLPPPPATATLLPPPVVSQSGDNEGDTAVSNEEPAAPEAPAVTEPQTLPPWPATDFGYGAQSHATVGDPAYAADVMKNQLGLDWIKVQLEWPLVQPDPDTYQWFFYDGIVDQAYEKGLYLMFSVVGAPSWTRAAGLLNRYPGKIQAIEVWNEQNLDREWAAPDGISPENYVEFLRQAHDAIKAVDPNVIVISGALSPTGPGDWVHWADDFEYLDRALAAGMLNYADCVGFHHNGYNVPPDVRVEDTNSLPEAQTAVFKGPFTNQYTGDVLNHLWTFKSTFDGYVERIDAYDANKKLCVTEFGWASSEGYDQIPEGFEFAQDNTLEEQAQYIVQAFQQMHDSGKVWLAFLFNFDFGNKGNGPTDDPVPYSIIDTNGAPRPAFGALAAMEKPR
ncbi:MAG: hypothetical protein P8183_09930 [Anaerolineae bacterium]